MEELTLVMLKPDGVALNLQPHLNDYIQERGLHIITQRRIRISKRQISQLYFPKHVGFRPLLLEESFHCGYLQGRLVDVFVVQGDDAIKAMMDFKSLMRRQFEKHWFANVLHTTASRTEFITHAATLLPERFPVPNDANRRRPNILTTINRNMKQRKTLSNLELSKVVRLILQQVLSSEKNGLAISDPFNTISLTPGDCALVLHIDALSRIDDIVDAILTSIPLLSLDVAIWLAFKVVVLMQSAVVIRCAHAVAIQYRDNLQRQGLNASIDLAGKWER